MWLLHIIAVIYVFFLTLKIACSVRRWRSVKTKRGFLAWDPETGGSSSEASLFLHTENREMC